MKNLEAQRSQYLTLYGQQLDLLRFLMNVGADYPWTLNACLATSLRCRHSA